jgi:nitrogen fixation NifU-like protein
MSRLQQLYQEMILEHNKHPRNFLRLDPHSHASRGKNPLCGDDYYVYLDIHNSVIKKIGFLGQGCAISKSAGSLMTQSLEGKTIEEAQSLLTLFIDMVGKEITEEEKKRLGKLKVFEGVKEFPVRVKCALLVSRALEDALAKNSGEISTE